MSPPLVSGDRWEATEPLLRREPPKPNGSRPRIPNRAALAGIILILASLLGYCRLGVRYERRSDVLLGLLHLACVLTDLGRLPA